MIKMIEAFAVIPNSIMRNITGKKQIDSIIFELLRVQQSLHTYQQVSRTFPLVADGSKIPDLWQLAYHKICIV